MNDFDLARNGIWDNLSDELAIELEKTASVPWESLELPMLSLQWLDDSGEVIGERFDSPLPPVAVIECPGEAGAIALANRAMPLMLPGEIPEAAGMLEFFFKDRSVGRAKAPKAQPEAGYAAYPDYQSDRIGAASARFTMHVFAERFSEQAIFTAKVEALWAGICEAAPFDRGEVADGLALQWHFAPSDPDVGHFDTPDSAAQIENGEGRLFLGNQETAEKRTRPMAGSAARSIILIDSPIGGGAGGSETVWMGSRFYYPSWASITSRTNEKWWQLCLHELGHGLGLGDEYSDAYPKKGFQPLDANIVLEPNISRNGELADPLRWPVTVPREHFHDWRGIPEIADRPDTVALFEGARYSTTGLFRPSKRCRMNRTGDMFCPTCQDLIARRLGSP